MLWTKCLSTKIVHYQEYFQEDNNYIYKKDVELNEQYIQLHRNMVIV